MTVMRRKHNQHNSKACTEAAAATACQQGQDLTIPGQDLTLQSRSPAYKKARQGRSPAMMKASWGVLKHEDGAMESGRPRGPLFECDAQYPSSPLAHTCKAPKTPPTSHKRSLKRLLLPVSRDSSSNDLLELLSSRPDMLRSLNSLDLSVCGRYFSTSLLSLEPHLTLSVLHQTVIFRIPGEILSKLTFGLSESLRNLNLSHCKGLKTQELCTIVSNCRSIYNLNIEGCDRLTNDAIESISSKLELLEVLNMGKWKLHAVRPRLFAAHFVFLFVAIKVLYLVSRTKACHI
jgi:hypothetical protein